MIYYYFRYFQFIWIMLNSFDLIKKFRDLEKVTRCAFGASAAFSSATHIIPAKNYMIGSFFICFKT